MTKVKKVIARTLDEALEKFLIWKKPQGVSEQTLLDYSIHINLLIKRYPAVKESFDEIESSVLDHWGKITLSQQQIITGWSIYGHSSNGAYKIICFQTTL
jgi:hypothetical protein